MEAILYNVLLKALIWDLDSEWVHKV